MSARPPSFYFLYIRAKLAWGFACRLVPFGKSRMTLKAPPPSTLLGALAYPLARHLGWPEVLLSGRREISGADRVREFVVSAHAKLNTSLAIKADINRVFWFDRHPQRRGVKTDAIALEKVYTSPAPGEITSSIELIYILRPETAKQALGRDWPSLLEAAAWGMTRVGQKESLISVDSVKLAEAGVSEDEHAITGFYFPLEACSRPPEGSWLQEYFVDPWEVGIGDYSGARRLPFAIPYSARANRPVEVEVELDPEKGLKVECDGHEVVSLRRWLGL